MKKDKKFYKTLFNLQQNTKLVNIAKSISPRLGEIFLTICPIMFQYLHTSGVINQLKSSIKKTFQQFIYQRKKQRDPICSKLIHDKCFKCKTCSKDSQQFNMGVYCESCFIFQKHKDHDFRLIETNQAVCDCGDDATLIKQSFCLQHSTNKTQSEYQNKDEDLFLKEMEFLLYIYVSMCQQKGELTDDSRKKQQFGTDIMAIIRHFKEDSYPNKIIVAKLFSSNLRQYLDQEGLQKRNKQTILHTIIEINHPSVINSIMKPILLDLCGIQNMQILVITEIFHFAHSSKEDSVEKRFPFSKISFHFLIHGNIIQKLLEQNKLQPLYIEHSFLTSKSKYIAYLKLYQILDQILYCKYRHNILELFLINNDVTKLMDYTGQNEQKDHLNQLSITQGSLFMLMKRIISLLNEMNSLRQFFLIKILKDCYRYLKNRQKIHYTYCIQRTFALAGLAYLKGNIQNLYDISMHNILDLFGEDNEQDLCDAFNNELRKYIIQINIKSNKIYKTMVSINHKDIKVKQMISIDHLFIKLLFTIIFKVQYPHRDDVFQPLALYIQKNSIIISSLAEHYQNRESVHLQQTMSAIFYQVCLAINYLIHMSETSLSETIGRFIIKYCDKQSIFELFNFITYLYNLKTPLQLKQHAQIFIDDKTIIRQYIKYHFQDTKRSLSSKEQYNKYNLSYNSIYLKPMGLKQNNTLYYIKLKYHRRSQISRFIFSYSIIQNIIFIFQIYHDCYQKLFFLKNTQSSSLIYKASLQTLILLYLQTKDTKFQKLIITILGKMPSNFLQAQYVRQISDLFNSNRDRIEKEKAKVDQQFNKMVQLNKKKQKKLKLQNKMNEMKSKSNNFLAKHNSLSSNSFNNEQNRENLKKQDLLHEQQCQDCIICHSKSDEKLCYLSHMRYSNLTKSRKIQLSNFKTQMPNIVITTCGHTIHQSCLYKHFGIISVQELAQVDFDCFVCKSFANALIPISHNTNNIKQTEVDKLFTDLDQLSKLLVQFNPQLQNLLLQQRIFDIDIKIRIFESLCDNIVQYGRMATKYFLIRMLPIVKQLLLYFSRINFTIENVFLPDNFNIVQFTKFIMLTRTKNHLNFDQSLIGQIEKGRQKLLKRKSNLSIDINLICDILEQITNLKSLINNFIEKYSINNKNTLFYQIPLDLRQLAQNRGKCPHCHKVVSRMLICFLCSHRICTKCKANIKKHVQYHLGQCAFLMSDSGDCVYYLNEQFIIRQSMYGNVFGESYKGAQLFIEPQQYQLIDKRFLMLTNETLQNLIGLKVQEQTVHQHNRCVIQ